MNISPIKRKILEFYYYLFTLLPIKLANRFVWVNPDVDWSISIYEGNDFLNLKPIPAIKNPAISRRDITDTYTEFVADPFIVKLQNEWLMFFEILNFKKDRGEIAFARSQDGYTWDYQRMILAEDFHLSYPYVFEFESNWYMIPETCAISSLRLYKATNFPDRWEFVSEILAGDRFVDASILRFEGVWWLFTGIEPPKGGTCDALRLYYADDLLGEWIEHPMSPIASNNTEISRPGGRVRQIDGRLIRFAQDCTPRYGYNVAAIEIKSLTKDLYVEAKIQHDRDYLFELGTMSFNHRGMHHLDFIMSDDRHCIACVDCR